ncbi:tyrosine-type recombinase/integrase [Rhodococcus pyridinivorans]|uniref:Integrase n=1 Tax=Rhodococcus pyridinivorans AK37 TaxID=1114960 RepID=H0JNC2_9NOCA|nr:site-specific integrase [Rhodococcus pyridinivorans]EHK84894.1 integrase [Rhodococcus pyridinivorans AK37]MCD2142285.1 site-specific integrase [Rhodococcus pyridinivorans]UPK63142.1 site-specific integrase [Rhodococcus pyridinivorans]
MAGKPGARGWGRIKRRDSGRYTAAYIGPDGALHRAPASFPAKLDAEGWLAAERRLIDLGQWTPPARRSAAGTTAGVSVAEYARRWLSESESRLKPRTVVLYRGYLDRLIVPGLGDRPLAALTAAEVRSWLAGLDPAYPTRNANAYALLRTILGQAVDDELLTANPARVKGAAAKHRRHEPVALAPAEIRALAEAMPARWRPIVFLAGFAGLRIGEIQALRRRDLALTAGECTVTVRRAAVRVEGRWIVDRPKSPAALRTVPLPPGLRTVLLEHLAAFAEPGPEALVVTAAGSTAIVHRDSIAAPLRRAAEEIGHPTLRLHDLRHSAATNLANSGATLADLMVLMGWTSAAMAARYTHSTAARAAGLAAKLWEQ